LLHSCSGGGGDGGNSTTRHVLSIGRSLGGSGGGTMPCAVGGSATDGLIGVAHAANGEPGMALVRPRGVSNNSDHAGREQVTELMGSLGVSSSGGNSVPSPAAGSCGDSPDALVGMALSTSGEHATALARPIGAGDSGDNSMLLCSAIGGCGGATDALVGAAQAASHEQAMGLARPPEVGSSGGNSALLCSTTSGCDGALDALVSLVPKASGEHAMARTCVFGAGSGRYAMLRRAPPMAIRAVCAADAVDGERAAARGCTVGSARRPRHLLRRGAARSVRVAAAASHLSHSSRFMALLPSRYSWCACCMADTCSTFTTFVPELPGGTGGSARRVAARRASSLSKGADVELVRRSTAAVTARHASSRRDGTRAT